MVLTVYSLHIVAYAILPESDTSTTHWFYLVGITAGILLLADMWRRRVSTRGPLEALLHICSTRVAHVVVRNDGRPPTQQAKRAHRFGQNVQKTSAEPVNFNETRCDAYY